MGFGNSVRAAVGAVPAHCQEECGNRADGQPAVHDGADCQQHAGFPLLLGVEEIESYRVSKRKSDAHERT